MGWYVVVEDNVDVGDVEPPTGDVGRDEDASERGQFNWISTDFRIDLKGV